MAAPQPFVLLDDASAGGAGALLLQAPVQVFVARQPHEVLPVLAAADAARRTSGGTLAGYLAYEAGLALEPRLADRAAPRSGAAGPLVWFGLFAHAEPIADLPAWLAAQDSGAGGDIAASIGPLAPARTIGDYLGAFDQLQDAIAAGDIYQANLTLPLVGGATGDPFALYAAIRGDARGGHGALVFDGSHWLLSFSPELFFALDGGTITTRPMKGTRPRGADAAQDAALAAELAASAKERAENLMITDLLRNDLARVARAGSVRVSDAFAVETYPTIHAMTSTVSADLAPGRGAMDVLRALFPCGSITGAPKIRAMELIDAVEPDARGPYCGAIGRIGTDAGGAERASFSVAIRTVRLTPGENGRHGAVMGVGGAIVADSDGMAEWRETQVKGGFLRGRAGGHDLIETMRATPDAGVALLGLHLDRLERSAAELGLACDRAAIAAAIEQAIGHLAAPARLRVVLARSGALALESGPLPAVLGEPVPVVPVPLPVSPGDWRLRHKTTDRAFYAEALTAAQEAGAQEAVLVRPDGFVTEGSFTSIFVERAGRLVTPPLAHGLLPGVARRALLEEGRATEGALTLDDLAGGFLLGNALRGLMPAKLMEP
ncbi:aminodeoxychorismate synthase component I [Croceibacterium ferulae]|uniref:aminodeoxychorismate synthase component I n=1 Tax=Croceibacterium ferulae TaxID=1854641 RepID=UPI000EB39ED5|nr:aminodeoxychorismate synthase component I [Croceibacterium ferulae]